jgi:MFS family permease
MIGRLGEARFVRWGFAFLVPGILLIALVSMPDGLRVVPVLPVWPIYVGVLTCGFGMGLAYSAHSQLALRSVDEQRVGATTASLQLSDNLGVALGTGVVGALVAFGDGQGWSAGDSVSIALVVPTAVAVLGIALSYRLPRSTTERVAAHPVAVEETAPTER